MNEKLKIWLSNYVCATELTQTVSVTYIWRLISLCVFQLYIFFYDSVVWYYVCGEKKNGNENFCVCLFINPIGFAGDFGGGATDGGNSLVTYYPLLRSAEFTREGSSLAADDNRYGRRVFVIN